MHENTTHHGGHRRVRLYAWLIPVRRRARLPDFHQEQTVDEVCRNIRDGKVKFRYVIGMKTLR